MFCEKCGNPMADGTQFCPKCGAQQRAARPQQQPYGYQQPQQGYGYQQPQQQPYGYQQPAQAMKLTKLPGTPIYDIIVYALAGLMLLGLILPFFTLSGGGESSSLNIFDMKGESGCTIAGILILVSAIGYFVTYALNYDKYLYISGAVAVLAQLIAIISVGEDVSNTAKWAKALGGSAGYGVGFWFVWIAAAAMIAFPFAAKSLEPQIGTRKIYFKR